MARLTTAGRQSRTKFPPQYARTAGFDHPFAGGGSGGRGASTIEPGMEAWRLPKPKVMRGVILCGGIKQTLCTVVN